MTAGPRTTTRTALLPAALFISNFKAVVMSIQDQVQFITQATSTASSVIALNDNGIVSCLGDQTVLKTNAFIPYAVQPKFFLPL
jgi:hypothetical protein